MHKYVSFDGRIVSAGEAKIGAITSAALYGRGVFTTIAIRNGLPFLWEKHWKRLQNDAAKIGLDLGGDMIRNVENALSDLIKKNEITSGRARVTFFDESPSAIWPFSGVRKTTALITTADAREFPEDLKIEMSNDRVPSSSRTAGIKSCNYLENLLAYEETRRRGVDEAIRLNERGEVASACMANVFWLNAGQLFTPSLRTGCLPGTTREFVLENIQCSEVEVSPDELDRAEAIFLTSSGLGVVRVDRFGERQLAGEDHAILQIIR